MPVAGPREGTGGIGLLGTAPLLGNLWVTGGLAFLGISFVEF